MMHNEDLNKAGSKKSEKEKVTRNRSTQERREKGRKIKYGSKIQQERNKM